jgi:hypothetical protein
VYPGRADTVFVSTIGSPIETSLVQAAQAQQVAAKARDRDRARADASRRLEDQVDLRIGGAEAADAVRKLPHNDSEQAQSEHQSAQQQASEGAETDRPHIDLTA